MSNPHPLLIFLFALGFTILSCESDKKVLKKEAPHTYIDSVFNKKFELYKPGFTGGDGTYSVLLPDGQSVWIFGDSFIGEIKPDTTREKTSPMYIRNCFIAQNKDELKILHQGDPKDFVSMAVPPEVEEGKNTELEKWYWPGDGFVHNDTLKVFMSKFHQKSEGMWGFEFMESDLIEYSLPDLKEIRKVPIPYSKQSGVHFGHALCETEDFLYIYGLKDKKTYVARAKFKNVHKNWEYYDGTRWHSDISSLKPMSEVDGSEQFSVIKLRDKYVLITQLGSLSPTVCSFLSDTPYGPWKNKQVLFDTPVPFKNKNLFTYNALAHPQFIENDQLLVSYNTNSFELQDHFDNAAIYRPRFMRVPIELIFK